jgi:hypothetical protein
MAAFCGPCEIVTIGCAPDWRFALTPLTWSWQVGVELALRNVNDIPEAELIDTLRDCISAHVAEQKGDRPTMDVDRPQRSPNTPLSLDRMLSLLVRYPVSGPPFRLALREILSNAEEITVVLRVLATWVAAWGEEGAMTHVDNKINTQGLTRASKGAESEGEEGCLPRLDLVRVACTCLFLRKDLPILVLPGRVVP